MRAERSILCYGDSNTWGYIPGSNDERFTREARWPGVLEAELGVGFRIIEEGLVGRTTVLDDPITPYRNGREYLIPCLQSHRPIDLVAIFLGTNDLADRYPLPAPDIARAAVSLAEIVRSSGTGPGGVSPEALLFGLPRLGPIERLAETMAGAPERASGLPHHFRLAAAELGVPYLDLSVITAYSELDGVHLDADGHRLVGQAAGAAIRRILI